MATSPDAIRTALLDVSDDALAEIAPLLLAGAAQARREILTLAPVVVAGAVEGSSALAADWYEELRDEASPRARHLTLVPEWGRAEKYGRALVWATEPLTADVIDLDEARSRLSLATEYEVFDGFTSTTDANLRSDAAARGWRRIANTGACRFCRMLADRGAVYRKETSAHFAAHTSCRCTIVPTFEGYEGPEASVIQYVASKKRTTAKDRARVRAYLDEHYGDD